MKELFGDIPEFAKISEKEKGRGISTLGHTMVVGKDHMFACM